MIMHFHLNQASQKSIKMVNLYSLTILANRYCQQELKRYDQARATLSRVMRDYPDTPAAAEAEARLKRLAEVQ